MKVRIIGNDLVAWTLAGALASTGCKISMQADALPLPESDAAEPDLLRLLQRQMDAGRLSLGASTSEADLLLLAEPDVALPELKAQVQSFLAASASAARQQLVALVQPVAIGTTDQLQDWLDELVSQSAASSAVSVVYWPAFIQAGRALESFLRPERILLGSHSDQATDFIRRLLNPFNRSRDTLLVMPPKEAELTKLAINGMLATRVSYMNELAQLAAARGIDIEQVRQGMGTDSRIGFQYLYPGCGFGGQAFLNTLSQLNQELDSQYSSGLLHSVCAINEQQKDLLFQKLWRFYRADLSGKTFAIWGVAFKPNTAAIDGSPALTLIKSLLAHGARVCVYDPMALPALKKHLPDTALVYADSAEQAVAQADGLLLVTEWKEFWNLDMAHIKGQMNTPLLLDGRNIYNPAALAEQGWIYSGIGRGRDL